MLVRGIILDAAGCLRPWTVPAVLLGVALLAYGLYAHQLGFYWDDWTFAWARAFRGLQGLKATFFINRPMRAYFEAALDPLLGVNPFAWQVFALLMRWAAAVSAWWFLGLVWPRHSRAAFMVALFYLVYPGYGQQSIAMTYHYFWFFHAILFLSFGVMVWGVRTPRRLLPAMTISFLLSAAQLFSSEYLIGLELLRPVFLWIALETVIPDPRQRLGRTIVYTLPFLILLGVYLSWRVFIFKFPTYQPLLLEAIRSDPFQGIIQLVRMMANSFFTVTVQGWLRIVQVPLYQWRTARFAILYPAVVICSLIGLLVFQNRLARQARSGQFPEKGDRRQLWQMLAVGLVAILAAGIPFYIINAPVGVVFENDRFTLPFIIGVSLLLAALLEIFLGSSQSIALASGLASLAIGVQLYNAVLFRNESDLQKSFAWQLTWRAPGLKPDTLILSDDATFPFTDDEALSFLVNWIYSPENHSDRFAYAYNTLSQRLGKDIPSLDENTPIRQEYFASAYFQGSTSQAIVLVFAPPACLRVLNPAYDSRLVFQAVTWEGSGQPRLNTLHALPALTEKALPLSNLDRVVPDPRQAAKPPAFILGPEPQHSWCYYFERADLARQSGDWLQVAQLGREAMAEKSLRPADLSEYLVFIEADLHLGSWQEARALSQEIFDWAPVLQPSLCALWQRAEKMAGAAGNAALLAATQQTLQCDRAP